MSSIISNMFFREITIIGQENLPKSGPVVLCGTHNSQYVDAMMMVLASPRPVNFLVAEKSTRHSILKYFVKLMHVVPVTRAIDKKIKCEGKLQELDVVEGLLTVESGTDFVKLLNAGDMIRVVVRVERDPLPHVILLPVREVLDSVTLKVKISEETVSKIESCKIFDELRRGVYLVDSGFIILPKIDQKKVFQSTLDALSLEKLIGIFPEGGSHDQTQLIDIKPGACIFAYKLYQTGGMVARVVPLGINYFGSHKFRSKVVVQIGTPCEFSLEEIPEDKLNGNWFYFLGFYFGLRCI